MSQIVALKEHKDFSIVLVIQFFMSTTMADSTSLAPLLKMLKMFKAQLDSFEILGGDQLFMLI